MNRDCVILAIDPGATSGWARADAAQAAVPQTSAPSGDAVRATEVVLQSERYSDRHIESYAARHVDDDDLVPDGYWSKTMPRYIAELPSFTESDDGEPPDTII